MPILYEEVSALIIERTKNHRQASSSPFIVAITGPVAVGKSVFTAELLLHLRAVFPDTLCINTDGFIFPTDILQEKGLMSIKGYPETYDLKAFHLFLRQLKLGNSATAPFYAVELYDRHPTQHYVVDKSLSIVLLEGLNVFHSAPTAHLAQFIDLTLYLDANEENLFNWYQARRLSRLAEYQTQASLSSTDYWKSLAQMDKEAYLADIRHTWLTTNLPNIHQHIAPHKTQADIIIEKQGDHSLVRLK